MKVYILTNEPFPIGMASTSRILCYAKSLSLANIPSEVLIYKRTESIGKKARNTEAVGCYQGVNFRYIGNTPKRHKNLFLRKFIDLYDEILTLIYLKKNLKKGDIVLCYFGQYFDWPALFKIVRSKQSLIIRDLCEYPILTNRINDKTLLQGEKYLKTCFRKYDGAICISQALLDISKKYHPLGQFVKIPILIDEIECNYKNVNGKKFNFPYIFHAGTLRQQKDGIVDILEAFAQALPNLPVGTKYIFTGRLENSLDYKIINDVILKYNLQERVEFLGYLERNDILSYIKGASLFIINKVDNIQNRYCFSTKLGEYLMSGNPIITTNIGESANYLTDKVNAIVLDSADVEHLSNSIIEVLNSKYPQIGEKGAETARLHFTISSQSQILKDYLYSLHK